MTKFFKFTALFIILALIMLTLISCGTDQRSDAITEFLEDDEIKTLDDYLKLAWSPYSLDDEYFVKVTSGFESYCKDNGYAALVADPRASSEEQYSEFENWVAMQVDAIAAAPIDDERLRDIVVTARGSGITVAGYFSKLPGADFNYTLDEYDLGYLMGQNALKWIDEKLAGKGRVFLVLNDTDEALKARGNGIEDVLRQSDGVIIVSTKSVDSVPDAKNAAVSVFGIYSNINVVVCINDDYAIGVLEVADDLEIEDENFYIGGAGYTDEALQEMNVGGSLFRASVNLSPYENGRLLAQMMAEAVVNGVDSDTQYFTPKSYWQNMLGWN